MGSSRAAPGLCLVLAVLFLSAPRGESWLFVWLPAVENFPSSVLTLREQILPWEGL